MADGGMCWLQLCVRAGDEKALAIRGQLLLEIHYMQMRRAVAQARGEFEYDRALAKRAYLIHKRLENESDEDLRRNLAVSHHTPWIQPCSPPFTSVSSFSIICSTNVCCCQSKSILYGIACCGELLLLAKMQGSSAVRHNPQWKKDD